MAELILYPVLCCGNCHDPIVNLCGGESGVRRVDLARRIGWLGVVEVEEGADGMKKSAKLIGNLLLLAAIIPAAILAIIVTSVYCGITGSDFTA